MEGDCIIYNKSLNNNENKNQMINNKFHSVGPSKSMYNVKSNRKNLRNVHVEELVELCVNVFVDSMKMKTN
ncbi:hypothetical protein ALNOE001_11590 [Candidatus Methanobinarius endosymbioticus]|uniref:Uncharacterized protein n=1 Tax=Candidatus Methanobinarius endosymbioticus TaxID=2006182 RepID=A0A366MBI4_9EURY|nr:hypothetical protein ALNOE001_11590 [Candidatus Methanobinarius endosymbioticus]